MFRSRALLRVAACWLALLPSQLHSQACNAGTEAGEPNTWLVMQARQFTQSHSANAAIHHRGRSLGWCVGAEYIVQPLLLARAYAVSGSFRLHHATRAGVLSARVGGAYQFGPDHVLLDMNSLRFVMPNAGLTLAVPVEVSRRIAFVPTVSTTWQWVFGRYRWWTSSETFPDSTAHYRMRENELGVAIMIDHRVFLGVSASRPHGMLDQSFFGPPGRKNGETAINVALAFALGNRDSTSRE